MWFLGMDQTSLNAKHGMERKSSFQIVLLHDLAYWDPFLPTSCPNETHFFNCVSPHAKLNSQCKAWGYTKKKHKKIKANRKSL